MLSFLLTLVDESDREKVEKLYKKYHDRMLKYAIAKMKSQGDDNAQHDAEDAVQNTFVKVIKSIDSITLNRSENEIKCYIYSILVSEIYNILRRTNITLQLDENDINSAEDYTPAQYAEFNEDYDKLVKAIVSLDEIYSTTIFMSVVAELSIDEIAALTGVAKKTVYTRLERGRKLLKKVLEGVSKK